MNLQEQISARKCHQDCEPKYLAIYDCGENEPQQYVLLCESSFSDKDFKRFAEIYDLTTGKLVFAFDAVDEEKEQYDPQMVEKRRRFFLDTGECKPHLPVTARIGDVIIKQCLICAKQLDKTYEEVSSIE